MGVLPSFTGFYLVPMGNTCAIVEDRRWDAAEEEEEEEEEVDDRTRVVRQSPFRRGRGLSSFAIRRKKNSSGRPDYSRRKVNSTRSELSLSYLLSFPSFVLSFFH